MDKHEHGMDVQQLFKKGLHDKAFFDQLQADPAKALESAGLKATPEQIASLKQINYKSLVDVATAFGGGTAGNIT
jgi:hypothetical protein